MLTHIVKVVPPGAPLKTSLLKLENQGSKLRLDLFDFLRSISQESAVYNVCTFKGIIRAAYIFYFHTSICIEEPILKAAIFFQQPYNISCMI